MTANGRSYRVRFADTDQQGVVYFGTFFEYMDEAAMAAWRQIGFDVNRRRTGGWTTHVVHTEMDYESSVTYGDSLIDVAEFTNVGETSFTMLYKAKTQSEKTLVARGETVYVTVDVKTGEPITVPAEFREAIEDRDDRSKPAR